MMKHIGRRNILFHLLTWFVISNQVASSAACADIKTFKNPSNLATPSVFQKSFPTENSKEFKESVLSDIKVLSAAFSIASHFLIDNKNIRALPRVIRDEFRNNPSFLEGVDLENVRREDNIVYIPYRKDKKSYEVRICSKERLAALDKTGLQWAVSANWGIQVVEKEKENVSPALMGQARASASGKNNIAEDELNKLKEMFREQAFDIEQNTLNAITEFCNGRDTFSEDDIVRCLKQIPEIVEIKINKDRIVDIYYRDKLMRFHKKEIIPVEYLGLRDRAYYKGIAVKVYVGNFVPEARKGYILGISGSWHDATAVLLKDGKLVAALEEERMTRTKHDTSRFPVNAIHRLLKERNLTLRDISHIAIGWNYNLYVDTPHSKSPADEFFKDMDEQFAKEKNIPAGGIVRRNLPERNKARFNVESLKAFLNELKDYYNTDYIPQVSFVRHHLSHAASAYYPSGFKEDVLVMSIDGYGDTETGTVWIGRNGQMEEVARFELPNSLGWVYNAITEYLGFRPTFAEGEVMGFAPYGEPRDGVEQERVRKLREIFQDYVHFDPGKGTLVINPENLYYGEMYPGKMRITNSFVEKIISIVPPCTKSPKEIDPLLPEDRPYANLAFVLQETTERIVVDMVRYYLRENPKTKGLKKTAFSGGTFLNILANGRLISEGLIKGEDIFVQPAASDAGTAIGAAAIVAKEIYGKEADFEMTHALYGPEYSDADIQKTLDRFGLLPGIDYEKIEDGDSLVEKAAQCIKDKEPIAWFEGRSELGPRALGARSVLLNLLDDTANNTANIIKGRQPWRPSASSITEEAAKEYFIDIGKSPFMIIAYDVAAGKKHLMASGVHQYGKRLARPQTVDERSNHLYWHLLNRVGELIGVPAVVNTSFNKQEPLVEDPEEAINTFRYMKYVDKLFMGSFIVKKSDRIIPTVISIQDEPELMGFLKQAVSTGDINDWDRLFDKAADMYPRSHKITVVLDCGIYGTKEIFIPLVKELFEGPLREALLRYVSSIIYNYAIEFGAKKIYTGSTSGKMSEVVFYLMKNFLKDNFKRLDYFANLGERVEFLPVSKIKITETHVLPEKRLTRAPAEAEKRGVYIGIDVGAARVKCVALKDGREVKHTVVDTVFAGGEELKELIKGLVRDMAEGFKVSGIGISLPGVVDSGNHKIIWLVNYEHKWKKAKKDYDALNSMIGELKEEYDVKNVGILNDASAFGIASLDLDKDNPDGILLALGTGVGAARIEKGVIETDRIEQSGGFAINVNNDSPFDEGCGVKGCFAAYAGSNGIIEISKKLGLPGIVGNEKLSIHDINELLKSERGAGYAEAKRIYDELAKPVVSWIELMHKMRGDKHFILTGGITTNYGGQVLLNGINQILSEELKKAGVFVALSKVDREYGGAIGAALFAAAEKQSSLARASASGQEESLIEKLYGFLQERRYGEAANMLRLYYEDTYIENMNLREREDNYGMLRALYSAVRNAPNGRGMDFIHSEAFKELPDEIRFDIFFGLASGAPEPFQDHLDRMQEMAKRGDPEDIYYGLLDGYISTEKPITVDEAARQIIEKGDAVKYAGRPVLLIMRPLRRAIRRFLENKGMLARYDETGRPAEEGTAFTTGYIRTLLELASADAVITGFDDVDRDIDDGAVPDTIVEAKKNIFERGLSDIIITEEHPGLFIGEHAGFVEKSQEYGRGKQIFLTCSGATGNLVTPGGEIGDIDNYRAAEFDDEATVEKLREAARKALVMTAKELRISDTIIDKIRVVSTRHGVNIHIGDDARFQCRRYTVIDLIRGFIKQAGLKKKLSGRMEITASRDNIYIMPTSKKASAIQIIKSRDLKSVVLIGGSVGTAKYPGPDRSLFSLTEDDLRRAGVTGNVNLIKFYVGDEEDVKLPYDVNRVPTGKSRIEASLKVYRAISEARDLIAALQAIGRHLFYPQGSVETLEEEIPKAISRPDKINMALGRIPLEKVRYDGETIVIPYLTDVKKRIYYAVIIDERGLALLNRDDFSRIRYEPLPADELIDRTAVEEAIREEALPSETALQLPPRLETPKKPGAYRFGPAMPYDEVKNRKGNFRFVWSAAHSLLSNSTRLFPLQSVLYHLDRYIRELTESLPSGKDEIKQRISAEINTLRGIRKDAQKVLNLSESDKDVEEILREALGRLNTAINNIESLYAEMGGKEEYVKHVKEFYNDTIALAEGRSAEADASSFSDIKTPLVGLYKLKPLVIDEKDLQPKTKAAISRMRLLSLVNGLLETAYRFGMEDEEAVLTAATDAATNGLKISVRMRGKSIRDEYFKAAEGGLALLVDMKQRLNFPFMITAWDITGLSRGTFEAATMPEGGNLFTVVLPPAKAPSAAAAPLKARASASGAGESITIPVEGPISILNITPRYIVYRHGKSFGGYDIDKGRAMAVMRKVNPKDILEVREGCLLVTKRGNKKTDVYDLSKDGPKPILENIDARRGVKISDGLLAGWGINFEVTVFDLANSKVIRTTKAHDGFDILNGHLAIRHKKTLNVYEIDTDKCVLHLEGPETAGIFKLSGACLIIFNDDQLTAHDFMSAPPVKMLVKKEVYDASITPSLIVIRDKKAALEIFDSYTGEKKEHLNHYDMRGDVMVSNKYIAVCKPIARGPGYYEIEIRDIETGSTVYSVQTRSERGSLLGLTDRYVKCKDALGKVQVIDFHSRKTLKGLRVIPVIDDGAEETIGGISIEDGKLTIQMSRSMVNSPRDEPAPPVSYSLRALNELVENAAMRGTEPSSQEPVRAEERASEPFPNILAVADKHLSEGDTRITEKDAAVTVNQLIELSQLFYGEKKDLDCVSIKPGVFLAHVKEGARFGVRRIEPEGFHPGKSISEAMKTLSIGAIFVSGAVVKEEFNRPELVSILEKLPEIIGRLSGIAAEDQAGEASEPFNNTTVTIKTTIREGIREIDSVWIKPKSPNAPRMSASGSQPEQDGIMRRIHEVNIEVMPPIEKGKTLWHVIPVSMVPQGPEYNQRTKFVEFINGLNRRYPDVREKIKVVTDRQDLAKIISELADDPNNIVDAALDNENDIDRLPDGVKMLVFKSKDGDLGNFKQLEGVLAALRALHIADYPERSERLSRIYRLLTGEGSPKEIPDISDARAFARIFQFILPPITVKNKEELKRLNENLLKLIESA